MEWLNFGIAAALFTQTGGPPPAPTPVPAQTPTAVAAPAAPAPAKGQLQAQPTTTTTTTTTGTPIVVDGNGWRKAGCCQSACQSQCSSCNVCCERKTLESDHAFDGFVGPISAPFYSKDPRSLTELRLLYVHNWMPGNGTVGGGDFDLFGAQVRLALSERLSFIFDKSGYMTINPATAGIGERDGSLNMSTGLKYTFLRDECSQTVAAAGVMYEFASGDGEVFQGRGDGVVTPFLTYGREFGCNNHFIGNVAYSFGLDDDNSDFVFTQLHFDRCINGWLYPLVEVNWIHYTQSGANPPAGIEGDTLVNFGSQAVAGNDLVTVALGAKAKLRRNIEAGIAYEKPISNREDLIDHRILSELIFRY